MTDSTIDEHAGDGSLEAGPTVEELFGPLEESRNDPPNDDVDPHAPETDLATIESRVDELAGRTPDDVSEQFEQVRSEADGECDVDGVLADESPEDIIAAALDGTDDPDGTDVLGDEDDLEDLLLTERRAGSEFLWVETEDEETASEDEPAQATPEATASRPADDAGSEGEALEAVPFGETGSEVSPSDDEMASEVDDRAAGSKPGDEGDAETVSGEDPQPDVEEDVQPDDSDDVQPDDSDDAGTEQAGADEEVDAGTEQADESDDVDDSSGLVGWLRRKLGSIF